MHGWQLSKNEQHERLPLIKISFCEIKLVTCNCRNRKKESGEGGGLCWPLSIHTYHDPVSEVGRWVQMTKRDQPKE